MKKLLTMAIAGLIAAGPVMADELVFPSLSYRTGPYAAGGIPFADGYADYFTLLNQRDGGIGGVMTSVPECETAYNTERGVECYESTKGLGALVYQPLSTGITYQLIPRATADGIPIHSMGYGRTSAADGTVFSNVFNYPGNYWDAASVMINYLLSENDGSLEGQKIVLLYHNSAYGREPIRTLEVLSEQYGFELLQLAVDHPGQEQGNQWLTIRREQPDYVLMWGWGVMNQVAVQEAANIRYPMDQFIGNWWSGAEPDVIPAGDAADGYLSLNMNGVGDMPVFDDIQEYVIDAGLAAGEGGNLGSVLYTRGMYAAMLAAEAVRVAQEMNGVAEIDAGMMRDGMENLNVTEEMMASWGAPGIGPEFSVSCEDHGGTGMGRIQQWNAGDQEWVTVTDFIAPDDSVTQPLILEDSAMFAEENNIERRCN
jgi:branched-chain amino acid transport system substrate-binding protein